MMGARNNDEQVFVTELKKIWWISLITKLIVAAILPLSSDEAYYWVWSKHLQLSYYDHPGMIAWLFKIGSILEPIGNAVRWPAVVVGHLAALIWILIAKKLFSGEIAKKWIYLSLFSPLLGFGSLICTPDVPVVFFWSLSCYLLIRVLENSNFKNLFLLGASLGLGFCSKYHIVLLPLAIVLWILFEKRWDLLKIRTIFPTLIGGIIFSSPVLIWNVQNDFISFKFQIQHGLGRENWNWIWTVGYLLAQFFAIFPTVFIAAWKGTFDRKNRLFAFLAWVPLGFFFLSSFKGKVELNWPIVGYPAIFLLAATKLKADRWFWFGNFFWVIIISAFSLNLYFPFIKNGPTKLQEPIYFQELSQIQKKYQPLYAGTYQMASQIWYMSKDPIYKLAGMSRSDFFEYLPKSHPEADKFYLVVDFDHELPGWFGEEKVNAVRIEEIANKFLVYEVRR